MDGWWLNKILGHVCRSESWAASLCLQFGVDIDALFEQDAFKQGVLVAEHETLISSVAVSCLEIVQIGLMNTDGLFQLLDVLGAAFTERSLSLPVSLLTLLRRSVDLCTCG